MATWRPLLEGELAAQAHAIIDTIIDRLLVTAPGIPGLRDAIGRAVLF